MPYEHAPLCGTCKAAAEAALTLLHTVQGTWTVEQYTQEALARTATGESVAEGHPQAVCWSLEGMLLRYATTPLALSAGRRALREALLAAWQQGVLREADRYDWATAQQLVARAIQHLKNA